MGHPGGTKLAKGIDVKEPQNDTATEAKIPEFTPGQAPQPSPNEDAARHRLSQLQGPAIGASRLSDLWEIPGTGRDSDARSGIGQLGASEQALTPFATFTDPIRRDRAFVFPGQGAQSVGMGKDLYEQFAAAREIYDRADEILGFKLSQVCFEGPDEELQQTRNQQPAIAVTSLALLRVALDVSPELQAKPAFVAGHSLGEYSALVTAGALPFDEAIRLLRKRGELMQAAGESHPGAMAAVLGLELADCEDVCRESGAEVCTINAPGQVVIGGRREAVVRAMDYAKARGAAKVIPLSVSGAFHSSLMRPAAEGMVQPVGHAAISDPAIPVIANCTGAPIHHEHAVRNELIDHICRPVQWSKTVDYLGAQGVEQFIEFGPGRVLTAIIKRMLRKSNCANVHDSASVSVKL
jgi:[acyl-carrier-protein] S-malonyltransferase